MTKIMIIDQDAEERQMLENYFRDKEYEVTVLDGNDDAAVEYMEKMPDVVITDFLIDRTDLQRIRSYATSKETKPLIYLLHDEPVEYESLGFDRFYKRPVDPKNIDMPVNGVAAKDSDGDKK